MMKSKYTNNQIKRIQKIELIILKDFIKICDDNNLDYFLAGGSAIGVVRHQGFIPWDDDIDIAMPRKDFTKFLDIVRRDYSDKYNIIDNSVYPDYPLIQAHMCLKSTRYITYDFINLSNINDYGIFLDIFPQDNMSDNPKEFIKQGTHAWFWGKLAILSSVKKPVLYQKGFKKIVIRFICKIIYYLFKLFHIKTSFFYNKANYWTQKYNTIKTKRFGYMFDPSRFTSVLYYDEVFPLKTAKFEGLDVKIPNKVEKYLELRYGDYMKLPPVEDRHNHPPYILDFGEYENL